MSELNAPVLTISFNRPDLTLKSLDRLLGTSRTIYIAIDGPRSDSESILTTECQKIAMEFESAQSRFSEVKFLFHTNNLGCKVAVRSAIDWAFSQEERLIILEDDIVFSNDFLQTMDNWLGQFEHEHEVFHLNGYTPISGRQEVDFNYFSRYTHVWGWATWKNRWLHYDRDLENWKGEDLRNLPGLIGQNLSDGFCDYWTQQLNICVDGYDTWDIQWLYSQWLYGGYALTPGARLTGNIGFDDRATHTQKNSNRKRSLLPKNSEGKYQNLDYPNFDLELNLIHDAVDHGVAVRNDFLGTPGWRFKIFLARKYLAILQIKSGRSLVKFCINKVTIAFRLTRQIKHLLKKFFSVSALLTKLLSASFHFCLLPVRLILGFALKVIRFVYWRILKKFI